MNRGFQQQASEAEEEETELSPSDDVRGKRNDGRTNDDVMEESHAENEAGTLLAVTTANSTKCNCTEANEKRSKQCARYCPSRLRTGPEMVKNERENGEQQSAKADRDHEREPDPVGVRPDTCRAATEHGNYRAETNEGNRDLSDREEDVTYFPDDSLLPQHSGCRLTIRALSCLAQVAGFR